MKIKFLILFPSVLLGFSCGKSYLKSEEKAFDLIIELAAKIAQQYQKSKRGFVSGRVAVLKAEDKTGKNYKLAEIMSDKVTDELFRIGVAVIERTRINQLIKELGLQQSDLFNKETTAKMGNLLGAKIISTGVIEEIGSFLLVSYRFVESETSDIMAVTSVKLPVDIVGFIQKKPKGFGIYMLRKAKVVLEETKEGGYTWDVENDAIVVKPDPMIVVTIGKNRPIQALKKDTYEATWEWREDDPRALILYDARDMVTIEVWDKDIWADDLVGKYSNEHGLPGIEEEMIFVEKFGRIKELRLEFVRID